MKSFRELLNEPGVIMAPGCYDALTARMCESAGFPVVFITGYAVSASLNGVPDIGITTMTDMANTIKRVALAVNVPIITDGDTGYGDIPNVIQTVRQYERAGSSAIQLEDQIFPKRCGHMENKKLISIDDMIAKIRAAKYARKSDDFIIIARTDARDVYGMEEAIKRGNLYREAGADLIYVESPHTAEEMAEIGKKVKAPLALDLVEGGKTPFLTAYEMEDLGYKFVIYPVTALYSGFKAIMNSLKHLKEDGTSENVSDQMVSFPIFNEFIGLNKIRALEEEIYENK